ncbi:MAG: SDR family oxidoreductase [Kiritimatiellaeota bacterium]|nr:SDR family oxidoreductase [Kiritimatiellota bacterium]
MNYLETIFGLAGRTAIVTGAARGNGRAMAEALLQAGAEVLLVDRLADVLDREVALLVGQGLAARAIVCDITFDLDRQRLFRELSRIDILVNNAGVTLPHPWLDYPADSWETTYRVNLLAPFELCRLAARRMVEQGKGSIINITSLNAELAFPDNPAYMAFKGALRQLTRSLALDLGGRGVRANCIVPGYIRTDMTRASWSDSTREQARAARTAIGRWGMPGDLAGAVIFLASDASAFVTGHDLLVDGGWSIKGL